MVRLSQTYHDTARLSLYTKGSDKRKKGKGKKSSKIIRVKPDKRPGWKQAEKLPMLAQHELRDMVSLDLSGRKNPATNLDPEVFPALKRVDVSGSFLHEGVDWIYPVAEQLTWLSLANVKGLADLAILKRIPNVQS